MSFTEIIYKTGELVESSFETLRTLQNGPNVVFIAVMSVLFVWWVWKMAQYDKEAEKAEP